MARMLWLIPLVSGLACATSAAMGADIRVSLPTVGWHLIAPSGDCDFSLADECFVRCLTAGETRPFCDVANVWVQSPMVYYDEGIQGYLRCGCDVIDTDHTLRAGRGYWVYTFEPNLELILKAQPPADAVPVVIEFPIVTESHWQRFPHVSPPWIVWADDRNGDFDVFGYNVLTREEHALFVAPNDQGAYGYGDAMGQDIAGGTVVFSNVGDYFTNDVWGHSLCTGASFPICAATGSQLQVDIAGSLVVWADSRAGDHDIYGMDLTVGIEFPICTEEGVQGIPATSGRYVVWLDCRRGGERCDLYAYDLRTHSEFLVAMNVSPWGWPNIDGSIAVWVDDRNGNNDIYACDLDTREEFAICTNPAEQMEPAISGDVVVWSDFRNPDECWIYGRRLGSLIEFPVAIGRYADISDHLVVFESYGQPIADIRAALLIWDWPGPCGD